MPNRARRIDQSNWSEYWYIMPTDECVYVWERISNVKQGWSKFPENSFFKNLQIPLSDMVENPPRFKYKAPAIKHAASAVSKFRSDFPSDSVFVPVPPSKPRDHSEYDSRLTKVLRLVRPPLDVRELIVLTQTKTSKQKGLTPEQRMRDYEIDEEL